MREDVLRMLLCLSLTLSVASLARASQASPSAADITNVQLIERLDAADPGVAAFREAVRRVALASFTQVELDDVAMIASKYWRSEGEVSRFWSEFVVELLPQSELLRSEFIQHGIAIRAEPIGAVFPGEVCRLRLSAEVLGSPAQASVAVVLALDGLKLHGETRPTAETSPRVFEKADVQFGGSFELGLIEFSMPAEMKAGVFQAQLFATGDVGRVSSFGATPRFGSHAVIDEEIKLRADFQISVVERSQRPAEPYAPTIEQRDALSKLLRPVSTSSSTITRLVDGVQRKSSMQRAVLHFSDRSPIQTIPFAFRIVSDCAGVRTELGRIASLSSTGHVRYEPAPDHDGVAKTTVFVRAGGTRNPRDLIELNWKFDASIRGATPRLRFIPDGRFAERVGELAEYYGESVEFDDPASSTTRWGRMP